MLAQIDKKYIKTRPSRLYSRLMSYALFEGRPLTTKGRWFNFFVFKFLKLSTIMPGANKVRKPVFILGTGRSGTTILGIILSMHKDVGYLNEPKALWNSIVPNEDIIGNYTDIDATYRLNAENVTDKLIQKAHKTYSFYEKVTFNKRTVDKYPEMIFRVSFLKRVFPDAKFLFLTRSGSDTCLSIDYWSERLGIQNEAETHDWWGVNDRKWKYLVEQLIPEHSDLIDLQDEMLSWKNHVDRAAVEWIVTMREGMKYIDTDDNSFHRLNYEKLCNNVETEFIELLDFLELPHDNKCIEYAKGTLKKPKAKPDPELHDGLKIPFYQTMERLGY
ncbi:MAG: sulfotransferase [Kangiellaceae bacterium]|nr:sulfotransferase [Kangiellaceae bacterium]